MPSPQRLLIHIGTDKTGTTSIQNFLYNNYNQLLKNNIHYPVFKRPDETNPGHFIETRHHGEFFAINSKFRRPMDQLVDQIIRKKYDFNVVSHESLWKYNEQRLNKIADAMDVFDLTIVMFVRHQASLLQSLASQRLKRIVEEGIYRSNGNIRQPAIKGISYKHIFLDYKNVIDTWKKVFPKSKIMILPFYKTTIDKINILDLFFSSLSIDKTDEYIFEKHRNLSIGYTGTVTFEFWRHVCEYLKLDLKKEHIDKAKELIRELPHKIIDNNKWMFHEEELEKICQKFEHSNNYIDKNFFPKKKWLSLEKNNIQQEIIQQNKGINEEYLKDVFNYINDKIVEHEK